MPHKTGPDWKLDRRDSGRLFWRRDSSTSLPSSPSPTSPSMDRVKFRYDVEVLEFWDADNDASDASDEDDVSDGEEDYVVRARRGRVDDIVSRETSLAQSLFACVLCLGVLVGTIVYQWWGDK